MEKNRLAIISVFNKTGILPLAEAFIQVGITILSTGGTANYLKKNGIKIREISDYTDFPEMMNGRVKTLHPRVHGGLLADRNNKSHLHDIETNKIKLIDFVIVNLYPFIDVIKGNHCDLETALTNIDIGGPTLLRSGAKNFSFVTVVTEVSDYPELIEALKLEGKTSLKFRKSLAVKVFELTSSYDSSINNYLAKELLDKENLTLNYFSGKTLRYGENPHQKAKLYIKRNTGDGLLRAAPLSGKEMSYNNYLDSDAALNTLMDFRGNITACVIKHTNPCGLATGKSLSTALKSAWAGDTVSSFGSVISVNHPFDLKAAEFFLGKFVEIILAPDFEKEAMELLKKKK